MRSEQLIPTTDESASRAPARPGQAELGPFPGYPQPKLFMFLTFLAFVLFRYVDGGNRMELLATIRLEFLLGGSAVIMAIVKVAGKPLVIGGSRKIIIFIALLFAALIVQVPFAADPAEAQRVFIDRAYKFSLLTFLIAALVETPGAMKVFLGAFLFAVFYVTLEATQGLITGGLVWENQGVMRLNGAVPMYGHPNSLAGVAMGALPFIIFLFRPIRWWWARLGLLALTGTAMVCVIYSASRTAYVGLISLLLWWFLQSPNKTRFLVRAAVVGVLAVPLIPDQYIQRFASIGGHEAEGNSKETRMVILQDALTIFVENPMGVGVGSFPAVRTARFGRSQDTHNLYLEVATNLGVQGLVVFLGLIYVMLVSLRRSSQAFRAQRGRLIRLARGRELPPAVGKRLHRHDQDLMFLSSVAQATAGFVIIRLTLGLFGMDLYEIYWWFASGVAIALAGLVVRSQSRTRFFEKWASLEEGLVPAGKRLAP